MIDTVKTEGEIENIACTVSTIQKCPKCGEQIRLDTDTGIKAVEMRDGMPYIRCGCGSIYAMSITSL